MLDEFIGTILQILVFVLIPFIVYLITKKKAKGFLDYIGLKPSTRKANLLAVLACLLFAAPPLLLTFLSEDFRSIMFDPNSVTGKFRAMGVSTASIITLIIIAVFKTAFAEELFFRGFVAKRLIAVWGFVTGNIVQALLFGILHVALFALATQNILFLIVIFVIPTIGAYVSAYLNEKVGNGSIIPGWISHALANLLAYSIVGFII